MMAVKVFVLLVILGVTTAHSTTRAWHKAGDGKKYLIETLPNYNWFEAYEECSKHKLQLLEIHSEQKNNIILELLRTLFGEGQDLWLGSNDEYTTSKERNRPFIWSTSGNVMKFSHWQGGEPNNDRGLEHCVHITAATRADFQWNDSFCDNKKIGFICEEHNVHTIFLQRLDNKRQHIGKVTKQAFASYLQELKRETLQLESSIKSMEIEKKELATILEQEHQTGLQNIGKHVTKHQEDMTKAVNDVTQPIRALEVQLKTAIEKSHDQYSTDFDKTHKAIDHTLMWDKPTPPTE